MHRTLVGLLFGVALLAGAWLWPPGHRVLAGRLYNNIGALSAMGLLGGDGPAAALDWYRKAAAEDCAAAEFNLGYAYQTGAGTPVNEVAARGWYQRAAGHGSALAANNLAILYANPAHGRAHLSLARFWLLRARALADGSLAGTVAESLKAMEHDMSAAQLAASEDPVRAAHADDPPPPRVVRAMTDRDVRRQVMDALQAAAPLREATTRYIAREHHLPTPSTVATDPAFKPIDVTAAHVALGTGAMVEITLRDGPYDGKDFGYVPLYQHGELTWICAHGHVPNQYFGAACR
jgi:hypothetical protein